MFVLASAARRHKAFSAHIAAAGRGIDEGGAVVLSALMVLETV